MQTQRQTIKFDSSDIPGGAVNLVGEIQTDGTPPIIITGYTKNVDELSFDIPLEMRGIGWTLNKCKCDGAAEINGVRFVSSVVPNDGVTLLRDSAVKLEPSVIPFPDRAIVRPSLPNWPPTNQGMPYGDVNLNQWFPPPPGLMKRYIRMNFGCVTIPNLPFVDGMESKNYDRVLTGFFGRYPREWQKVIADTYAQRPYSHFLRWTQDEMSRPDFSIGKYVDECKLLKDCGIPVITHSFLSKTWAPKTFDVNYLRDTFGNIIDACQQANVMDQGTIGFEMTAVIPNNDLFFIVDYFTVERGLNEANGCEMYVHHISGYTWPGVGAPDRFRWWQAVQDKLTGLFYQCDPAWTWRYMQDKIGDTTNNVAEGFINTFTFGHQFDLVALEPDLERAFGDNADLNEDDLDGCGFALTCTPGQIPVMGYGCGGRYPDGRWL